MKENFKMINKKVMEYLYGMIKDVIKVIGKMENM